MFSLLVFANQLFQLRPKSKSYVLDNFGALNVLKMQHQQHPANPYHLWDVRVLQEEHELFATIVSTVTNTDLVVKEGKCALSTTDLLNEKIWKMVPVEDGYYVVNKATNKPMSIIESNSDDPLEFEISNHHDFQIWQLVTENDVIYQFPIKHRHSVVKISAGIISLLVVLVGASKMIFKHPKGHAKYHGVLPF